MKKTALLLTLSLLPFASLRAAESPLRAEFLNPPDSSRPRTWWHWMDDKVTKEGITKDLEAMKAIGLKGAHITNIGQGGLPDGTYGDACVLTPLWLDLVEHAAKECQRLALQLGMSSASGCSGSGGPWITPELSMQEIVWTATHVEGGKLQTIALPQPRTNHHYPEKITMKDLTGAGFWIKSFACNRITYPVIPPPVKHSVTLNLCFFKSWVHEKSSPISLAGR